MASAQKQYTNEMKRKFGYYATWNPGVPVKLGDIGTFKKNIFTRISDLDSFGIKFEIRPDDTKTPLEYASQGSVAITTKLSGNIAPPGSVFANADAGIIVEFSAENATLFKANNTTSPSIRDTVKVGDEVMKLYRDGKWNKNWVVVTELIEAESATIIISNTAGGKVELKANANIDAPYFDIADGKFNFSPSFSNGLETRIISAEGLTPLFKIMGMKTRLFLKPVFRGKAIDALDLITPVSARTEHRDSIYFGYISGSQRE